MRISNPEDVISQLPDDILISIISLIPTKEALSTRILSKRWTNLFRFVPTITFCAINLECTCTCNSEVFLNGVHKVLRRHLASIRSFVLRCCIPDSCTHTLEQSIFALGDLGVKELTLRASCSFNFPSSFLFSFHLLSLMSSLQYLKLSRCSLQPSPIIYLSNSLKTLRLCKVIASSGSLESILSSCLSLCTLTLKQCELPFKLCFPRINLQIKCIVIHECKGIKEIYVYASNLTTVDFHSKSRDMVNLIFDYVPRLQIVYLAAHRQYMSYYCGRLAKYLPSLKTLVLDNIGNLYEDGCIATGIDMFKNLKRLELVVFTADYLDLFSLSRALQEFPRLEEFHLSISSSVGKWPKEENQVMVHSQSQLKVVEISGFGGRESEVQFALYILKSAALLEQMIISWYACLYDGFGRWGEPKYPPCYLTWQEVYDCIQQMKHEAVSKTLQVVAQELPPITSKQF